MRACASSIRSILVATTVLLTASPCLAQFTLTASPPNASISFGNGSMDGSGSALKGEGDTVVLPCAMTQFYSFYTDENVTQCDQISQFSFTYPATKLTNDSVSSICGIPECVSVFNGIASLRVGECKLTEDILLQQDVMWPLINGNCTGFFANFTQWDETYTGSGTGALQPFPAPYDPDESNATTVAAIVSIAVGSLLAFIAVVVAFVWYKRQRLRHYQPTFQDPLMDAKHNGGASPQLDRSASGATIDTSDGQPSREPVGNHHPNDVVLPPPPLAHMHLGTSLWSDEDLLPHHMRNEDVEDIRVIGHGGHGIVFLVRYRQTRLLASKRLVKDRVTREKTRALVAEIKLVAKLAHPCIVQFVGAAWTTEADLQALFEYMPNGDLCTHLAKTIHDTTWTLTKLKMALEIAEALIYVHSFSPPLVHRDLKSNNVLLTEDMHAKLSDFGVSRFQSDACTMTLGVGSGRWLAPEVMAGGGEYNQSCDVYSLGIVLSEMDTHRLPFSDLRSASGNPMAGVSILQLVSLGQLQPTFTASCPESIRAIALRCLAFNPKDRPNAIEVSYTLRTIAKTEFGL
nr:elicitin-like protein [Pythium porphyrae]